MRCKAKTKKNESCKNHPMVEKKYCYTHRLFENCEQTYFCPVCMETDNKMLVLSCKHTIHKECAKGLTSKNCPICRSEVKWPRSLSKRIKRNEKEWNDEMAEEQEQYTQNIIDDVLIDDFDDEVTLVGSVIYYPAEGEIIDQNVLFGELMHIFTMNVHDNLSINFSPNEM